MSNMTRSSRAALAMHEMFKLENGLRDMEDEEIDLTDELETLRASIVTRRRHVAHMRNGRALIHILPVEMLAATFLSGDTEWDDYALTISHVCQHWRGTALSLPALWSRIHICPSRERLRMIKLLLHRSQGHPLDILVYLNKWEIEEAVEFDEVTGEFGDQYKKLRNQLNMVSDTVPRWRSLAIYDASYKIYAEILHFLSGAAAPLLEILDVRCHEDVNYENDTDFSGVLGFFVGGAPKLHDVTFRGLSCYVPEFPSVNVLRLRDVGGSYIYQQIRQAAASLTEMHLLGRMTEIPRWRVGPSCTLPHLKSLVIAPWDDKITDLLGFMNAPALSSLSVELDFMESSAFNTALLSVRGSITLSLQSLSLYYADFTQSFAETITTKIPSIQHITLSSCKAHAHLLQHLLNPVAGGGIPWPQLETIFFSPDAQSSPPVIDASDIDIICDLVADRMVRQIPLVSIIFDSSTFKVCDKEQLGWLNRRVSVISRPVEPRTTNSAVISRCDNRAG